MLMHPGYPDKQKYFQHQFLMAFIIILISTIILAAINFIISQLVNNQLDQNILDKVILPGSAFAPEQVERTQYLVSLTAFPVLCFAGWLLSHKLRAGNQLLREILYPVVAAAVAIGIALWLYSSLATVGFVYVKGFTFLTSIFYLMFLALVYIEWKYSPAWLAVLMKIFTFGIALFLSLSIIFFCFRTETDWYVTFINFNAYFYSLVQVFGGKTLLIDLNNTYGAYPYFLEPIFRIIGLEIIQFTSFMGILLAGFFLILFFLINRLIRSRLIVVCSFLAIAGTWLWFVSTISGDPYFQYWPHRLLFPGLLILIVWFYQKASSKTKLIQYYLAFVISGISLLWNLETGIVVFGTWVLFLYWETLGQCKAIQLRKTALEVAKHSLIGLSVIILTFGSLYFYTFVRSGFFPDMSKYFDYQSLFYGAGFNMLPMPLIHPWNLVIFTYMVGICISFNYLVKKLVNNVLEEDQAQSCRANMIFIISIMGTGLFSYYQGRSHDYCLLVTFWSAFFLIAIYADILLSYVENNINTMASIKSKASTVATGSLLLLLTFVLVCYAGGIVELFPKFAERIQSQALSVAQQNEDTSISIAYTNSFSFIKRYFSPGDEVLIFSGKQALFCMKSGTTNPVGVPGFWELMYKSDQQRVFDYLLNGIAVDNNNRRVPVRIIMADDYKSSEYFQLINDNYIIIDRVGDLTLYEKRLH